MNPRLSGTRQAGTRDWREPIRGRRWKADDAHRPSWRPDAVGYMSVDTATQLTLAQLATLTELADEWSFLWDKRRQLWIAAQDSPDGVQLEEADLDALLERIGQLPG
jgi:hypothetical protein